MAPQFHILHSNINTATEGNMAHLGSIMSLRYQIEFDSPEEREKKASSYTYITSRRMSSLNEVSK